MRRYMVVYLYGGVYADMDTRCHRPASAWAPHGCHLAVGLENDAHFCQWAFAAVAGHGALGRVLELVLQRMQARVWQAYIAEDNWEFVHEVTGPSVFTEGILDYLRIPHTSHDDVNLAHLVGERGEEMRGRGVCLLQHDELEEMLGNQYSSWHFALQGGSWSSWTRERAKLMKTAKEERTAERQREEEEVVEEAVVWDVPEGEPMVVGVMEEDPGAVAEAPAWTGEGPGLVEEAPIMVAQAPGVAAQGADGMQAPEVAAQGADGTMRAGNVMRAGHGDSSTAGAGKMAVENGSADVGAGDGIAGGGGDDLGGTRTGRGDGRPSRDAAWDAAGVDGKVREEPATIIAGDARVADTVGTAAGSATHSGDAVHAVHAMPRSSRSAPQLARGADGGRAVAPAAAPVATGAPSGSRAAVDVDGRRADGPAMKRMAQPALAVGAVAATSGSAERHAGWPHAARTGNAVPPAGDASDGAWAAGVGVA